MHVIINSKKWDHYLKESGENNGREEREKRNIIKLQSQKQKRQKKKINKAF